MQKKVTSKDGTEIAFEKSEVSAHETPPADMAEKLTEFFLIQQLKEIEAMGFESKVFL